MKHEVLEEVWRARDQIAAECGFDLGRLAKRMRKIEARHADRLVNAPAPKKPAPSTLHKTTRRRQLAAA